MTNTLGVTGFAIAGVLSLLAARRTGRRVWLLVFAACLLAAVEIDVASRFAARGLVKGWVADGVFGLDKYTTQYLGIALVGLLFLAILIVAVLRSTRGDWQKGLALLGVGFSFTVFLVEAVSLQESEPLLYLKFGSCAMVGWLWLGGAALISAGAVTAR